MNIDSITERKIKEAANIVDVVGEFVQLQRSGAQLVGYCPFHSDHFVGSFVVSPSKNICKCFSCDCSGKGALDPIGFLMNVGSGMSYSNALLWIADRYGIWVDTTKPAPQKKFTPRPLPPELPTITFPISMVKRTLTAEGNPLIKYLRSLNWSDDERVMLEKYLQLYAVGTSSAEKTKGWTIWWYMDENMKVRTGKMMAYKTDGHRNKTANPYMDKGVQKYYSSDWIHSLIGRQRNEPKGRKWLWDEGTAKMETCLFGLHLVDAFPDAEVCIVESEKTALIAQTICEPGKKVFMATGSKGTLTPRMLKPLIERGRKITLYPDVDGLEEWTAKMKSFDYKHIIVTENVRRLYDPTKDDPKSDIADIIIRMLDEKGRDTNKEAILNLLHLKQGENKPIEYLIDNLNLKLINKL